MLYNKRPLKFFLGHVLMFSAVLVLVGVYYPLINIYFNPPPINNAAIQNQGYFLTIPKIQAQAPIFPDVDPWNEKEYRLVLEKGIAQTIDSPTPPNKGTIFLFAHSSDFFWRITRYNTIFLKLNHLKPGDKIILTKDSVSYNYEVYDTKVVNPNQVDYLRKSDKNQLILQTCTPIGTAFKRLLVFANPTY